MFGYFAWNAAMAFWVFCSRASAPHQSIRSVTLSLLSSCWPPPEESAVPQAVRPTMMTAARAASFLVVRMWGSPFDVGRDGPAHRWETAGGGRAEADLLAAGGGDAAD